MVKQKLTLSIDKEIITQAKKLEINLSSFLEIRLIDHLSDKEKCSRRDSNPSSWLSSDVDNPRKARMIGRTTPRERF